MRARAPIRPLALLLLLLASACGSGPQLGTGPHGQPNLLTRAQIDAAEESNAYELVQRLRPNWLHKRGARDLADAGDVVVYQDRTRMGGPEALRAIAAAGIEQIRFFAAQEADTRFGRGHQHGAIVVVTRSR
jgi:hypothetical protein